MKATPKDHVVDVFQWNSNGPAADIPDWLWDRLIWRTLNKEGVSVNTGIGSASVKNGSWVVRYNQYGVSVYTNEEFHSKFTIVD